MNLLQTQEFAFKFSLSSMDTATWFYIVLVLLFFIVGLGFLWGKCWNKKWGLSTSVSSLLFTIFLAILGAFAVFNLRVISKMEGWFEFQRETLGQTISASGTFNRAVFLSTWDQLAQKGGQVDLSSPLDGGNELRLNNPEETKILSITAADETRGKLRTKVPFSIGVPLATKSSDDVALEALDAIQFDPNRYPVVVSPANEWTKTVVKLQTDHALATAFSSIKPAANDLKHASLVTLICAVLLVALLIPMSALNDIQANPSKS